MRPPVQHPVPQKKKKSSLKNKGAATPALGNLRQENLEFKASLGYMVRLYLKNQNQNKQQTPNRL
jgi:hypothetical protein